MRTTGISIVGLMALVAMAAVDFAVLAALRHVMEGTTRISLFGALLSANVLVVALVKAIATLSTRGEVSLSLVTFLLVGGIATVLLIFMGILAPGLFYSYVDIVATPLQNLLLSAEQRRNIALGRTMPPVLAFGLGGLRLLSVLVIGATVTFPVLLVATLAARTTRGRRLRLDDTTP